jgi:hypothetical protein
MNDRTGYTQVVGVCPPPLSRSHLNGTQAMVKDC